MSNSIIVGKHVVEDKKEKAVWDDKQTEIFIKICVQEIREGNRPTSHFNRKGWSNLQEKFNKLTCKKYDIKQFKNKWENCKKDWQLWRKLVGTETGLGWNSSKRTIDASEEWWAQKLKELPQAIKYKEKGLLFADEMEILFGDVVASGSHAWTPASGSLPQMYDSSQGMQGGFVISEESEDSADVNTENNFNLSKIDSSINIDIRDAGSKQKGKRSNEFSSSTSKSNRKKNSVDIISSSLDKLTGAFESYRTTIKEKAEDDGGLQASVDILNSLPIDKTSDFFYDCVTILVKKKEYRKMLQILTLPEQRLGFLKRIVAML